MTRKSTLILIAIAALVGVAVFTVQAQDNPATPRFGPGMMHGGRGSMMMNGGFGNGMMWGDEDSMMTMVAKVLGLEPAALVTDLHNGQTLTEIAKAQGVELQTVYDAIIAQAEEHMAVQVKAGNITQAQADEHLSWMRENITQMPMFSGSGFGPCMGNDNSSRPGMMGRGHGIRWNHA